MLLTRKLTQTHSCVSWAILVAGKNLVNETLLRRVISTYYDVYMISKFYDF